MGGGGLGELLVTTSETRHHHYYRRAVPHPRGDRGVVVILRYRLYDIDRTISRNGYLWSRTASLLGIYVAIVFVLTDLIRLEGDLAVAGATSREVAALFSPTSPPFASRQSIVDLTLSGAAAARICARELHPPLPRPREWTSSSLKRAGIVSRHLAKLCSLPSFHCGCGGEKPTRRLIVEVRDLIEEVGWIVPVL